MKLIYVGPNPAWKVLRVAAGDLWPAHGAVVGLGEGATWLDNNYSYFEKKLLTNPKYSFARDYAFEPDARNMSVDTEVVVYDPDGVIWPMFNEWGEICP